MLRTAPTVVCCVECLERVLALSAAAPLRLHWMDDDGECTRYQAKTTPGRQLDEVLRVLAGGGWVTGPEGDAVPVLAVTVSGGEARCYMHALGRLVEAARPPRPRRRLTLGRSACLV